MSESGDYDPGPWAGHDFASAYRRFDDHVGRSYEDATERSVAKKDLLEPEISTECTNPLVIFCDVTGSMGEWPKTIFSKLPYLELEGQEYLGKDLEVAIAAVGDASADDDYPLQVRNFTSGTDLKEKMLELVVEGGGGSGLEESYELAALYALHNISMPKAIKPVCILIGDEMPYMHINKSMAEAAGVKLQSGLSTEEVFKKLREKFSVYLIRKTYHADTGQRMSSQDRTIYERWSNLLGGDRICDLPEAGRVVDVIFGILAQETGRIEYFRDEIEERQEEEQVETVYKSLASLHKLPRSRSREGQPSILKLEDKGMRSINLLGDKESE